MIYYFNYNSNLQRIETPIGRELPAALHSLVMANRFLIENDAFELLRMRYDGKAYVIRRENYCPIMIGQVQYNYSIR